MTAKRKAPGVELVPVERIVRAVHVVRGERVLFDEDLAELYGVEVKALNQAVTRNAERFPADFAFRLTREEWADLKSQSGTSSAWGRPPEAAPGLHGARRGHAAPNVPPGRRIGFGGEGDPQEPPGAP